MKFNVSLQKNKYRVVSTPSLPVSDFEQETQDYINGLDISYSIALKINQLVLDLKNELKIAQLDEVFDYLYIFAVEKEAMALRNITQDDYHCTKHGNLAWIQFEGFTSSGNTEFLDTNFNVALDAVNYTQDDAGEGIYIRERVEDSYDIPSGNSVNLPGTNVTQIFPKVAEYLQIAINSTIGSNQWNVAYDKGMYAMFRDSATAIRSFINTMQIHDDTANNSEPLLSQQDYICCRNFNGVADAYYDKQISMKFKSRSLTESEYLITIKAFEKYMHSINKSVTPYIETQVDKSSINLITVFQRDVDYPGRRFRIPFILITNTNTLMCGCEGRETSSDFAIGDIVYKKSTDFGISWSAGSILIPNNGVYLTTQAHGSRVVNCTTLKVGSRIYMFATKIDDETYLTYYGYIHDPLLMQSDFGYIYSDDDGATWSAWNNLNALKNPETNMMSPSPSTNGIIMENGTLVVPCLDHRYSANETEGGTDWGIRSFLIYSTDNGATWQKTSMIEQFTDEATIVEYEPGKIFLKSRNFSKYYRVYTTNDLGATWIQSAYDKKYLEISCQTSLIKYIYRGRTRYFMASPYYWATRKDIRLRISEDLINWGNVHQLWKPISAGYTAIDNNINGRLFACLEDSLDIDVWDFSAFKEYLIK